MMAPNFTASEQRTRGQDLTRAAPKHLLSPARSSPHKQRSAYVTSSG